MKIDPEIERLAKLIVERCKQLRDAQAVEVSQAREACHLILDGANADGMGGCLLCCS